MRVLTARWSRGLDLVEDRPDWIFWGDGNAGTIDDYVRHSKDSYRLDHDEHGWRLRMFPDLAAKVWYDTAARSWIVGGEGIPTESLGLSDPHASDEQIHGQLYSMRTVYRADIIHSAQ